MNQYKLGLLLGLILTLGAAGCLTTQPDFQQTVSNEDAKQTINTSTSFTYDIENTISGGDATVRYNTGKDAVILTRPVHHDGDEQTEYITETSDYRRALRTAYTPDDKPQPVVFDRDTNVHDEFGKPVLRSIYDLDDITLNRTGSTQFDGQTVGVYKTSSDAARDLAVERTGVGFISNTTLTVYATPDGNVVYQQFATDRGNYTVSVTNINSTAVNEPAWVADAVPPEDLPAATLDTEEDGDQFTYTISDANALDTLTIRAQDGTVLKTPDGEDATITNAQVGDTITVDLKTDTYDVRGDEIIAVVGNDNARIIEIASIAG